jgi:hypothetical protein
MKVLVYNPGQEAEERVIPDDVPHGLKALQDIVGGPIETINTAIPGIILIVNEEGHLYRLTLNRRLQIHPTIYMDLYGPIVACRVDGDEITSLLPGDDIVLRLLLLKL